MGRGGVVNRRGNPKARVVSPVMGRDVCADREPDCLKPTGTGQQGEKLPLAYTIRIHLEKSSTRIEQKILLNSEASYTHAQTLSLSHTHTRTHYLQKYTHDECRRHSTEDKTRGSSTATQFNTRHSTEHDTLMSVMLLECNTLQHAATHGTQRNMRQTATQLQHIATHCNSLHSMEHDTCGTLQHTATHCNTRHSPEHDTCWHSATEWTAAFYMYSIVKLN